MAAGGAYAVSRYKDYSADTTLKKGGEMFRMQYGKGTLNDGHDNYFSFDTKNRDKYGV